MLLEEFWVGRQRLRAGHTSEILCFYWIEWVNSLEASQHGSALPRTWEGQRCPTPLRNNALHLYMGLFPVHTKASFFCLLSCPSSIPRWPGLHSAALLASLSRLMHHGMLNALSTRENMLVNDYTWASVTTPHLQHSEKDSWFPMSLRMAFFKTVKLFCLCKSPHNLRVSKLGTCWTQSSREGTELSHSELIMKSTSRLIVTGNCPGFLAAFCGSWTCHFICWRPAQ